MTSGRSASRRADRVYGWLLRCYPRAYRARFEHDMRHAFEQERADARARGVFSLIRFWLATTLQAIVFGLDERRTQKRGSIHMHALTSSDWKAALASLRATPIVTMVAVLSLALGTGANTALFSILNSMNYKPLPVRAADELVLLHGGSWTNPIWEQVRARTDQFSQGAFAWGTARFDVAERGETEYVPGAYVSGSMFDVLGVPAALGRTLSPADDARGANAGVAMISHQYWQQRLGGATDVIGRTVNVHRVPFQIVGVMPPEFFGLDVGQRLSVVIPIAANELIRGSRQQLDGRSVWWLEIMARLKPGQRPDGAAAALNAARGQIRDSTMPLNWRQQDRDGYLKDAWSLEPASTGMSALRTTYQSPLTIVLVIVGIVLVIACANIANLLIARATARRREFSVRMALGATRWRLARHLLLESLMIAVAGALVGLLVAQWIGSLLVSQLGRAAFLDLAVDWRVLGFTSGVAVATALLFGVAPAIGVASLSPQDALRARGHDGGERRFNIRQALVTVQVALSLALVIGGGLFLRTFQTLAGRPLGFEPDGILVASVSAPASRVPADAWTGLQTRLLDAARAVPGVESAGLSFTTPVGNASWNTIIHTDERAGLSERERTPWVNLVSPGWLATYRTPVLAGRDFSSTDVAGAPAVAIVNQAFASRYYSTPNPVGRQFKEEDGTSMRTYEIVGVVADSVYQSLRAETPPIMYRPLAQGGADGPQGAVDISIRVGHGEPAAITPAIVTALLAIEPSLRVNARPLVTQLQSATRQERLVALISGSLGGLALLLAGLGMYGVTAYAVTRRRAEIGIRMALGARPVAIVTMVLVGVARLVGAGLVLGVALSAWMASYAGSLLYGIGPRDPRTLTAAACVLVVVGLVAAWLPARRAARLDPTVALRGDS